MLARAKDVRGAGAPSPASAPERAPPALSRLLRLLGRQRPGPELHRREPRAAAAGRGRVVLTEALAGSTGRGATASEDAALGRRACCRAKRSCASTGWCSTRSSRSSTAARARAGVTRRGPALRRLANVQHLHTPVEAEVPAEVRAPRRARRASIRRPPSAGTPREAAVPADRARWRAFPAGFTPGPSAGSTARGGRGILRRPALRPDRRRRGPGSTPAPASSRVPSPEKELAETELKFRAMQDALLGV